MKKIIDSVKRYSFFYILGVATMYAIFYSVYSLNEAVNGSLNKYDKVISYFANVSILFFTAGIFSVSLKYFQFLGIFEAEFKKSYILEGFR
ncbi:hypothetical protein [Algibacter sp. 2305UL17-15]|uniref:hypothetical protein n=1 Tax=Algibacter sp. 2305UL17-15 TaxID=3231268 RepID=UPI0034581B9B